MSHRSSSAGFTLVGVMVAVAVVNILLAVAMTSWLKLDRRAREAELIWRGEQIARALGCFQSESGGSLPEALEELIEIGCLRRVYEDPLAADGRWRILTEQDLLDGTIAALSGDPAPEGDEGAVTTPIELGSDRQAPDGNDDVRIRVEIDVGQTREPSASRNGIVGVSSRSEEAATRRYRDRTRYSEWLFLVQPDGGSSR